MIIADILMSVGQSYLETKNSNKYFGALICSFLHGSPKISIKK